jgi:hypothetical protein
MSKGDAKSLLKKLLEMSGWLQIMCHRPGFCFCNRATNVTGESEMEVLYTRLHSLTNIEQIDLGQQRRAG